MTLFFTATAVSPIIVPWEAQLQTLERLISAPISIITLIFGDMLASLIFGIGISLVPLFIGLFIGTNLIYSIVLILGIILGGICFSSLGLLLSTPPTNAPSNIMMISSLVRFPVVFISGIFIPLENMPFWGKVVASFSPLTYFTDLTRYSIGGTSYYSILFAFIALIIFTVLFFVLAVKLHQRTIYQRL